MLRNISEIAGNSVLIQNQNSFYDLLQNAKQKLKRQFLKLNIQTQPYRRYANLTLAC